MTIPSTITRVTWRLCHPPKVDQMVLTGELVGNAG